VIDEELRAPSEEVWKCGAPLVGIESILLVDANPGQCLPPTSQLVAAPREILLSLEQLEPCCEPLLTSTSHVLCHRSSLLRYSLHVVDHEIVLAPGIERWELQV
jgi:hypothetical protein